MPATPDPDATETSCNQALVRRCMPLVGYAVAELSRRLPAHVDRDDLTSAGMLGLAQAATSWDPERGVTFERYARRRIHGALLDELRTLDWATRSVRSGARLLQAAGERISATTREAPSVSQLAEELGLPAPEVHQLIAKVHQTKVLAFDAIATTTAPPTASRTDDEPARSLLQRELLGYLRDAVVTLPDRLRTVVVGYYLEERQLQDIADELGVSESRISQMRAEAVSLLRTALACLLDDEPPSTAHSSSRASARTAAYVAMVGAASDHRERLSGGGPAVAARLASLA